MKHLNLLIIVALSIFSCNNKGYEIEGTAKGVYNGMRVYLKNPANRESNTMDIDTALVIDEKFEMKGDSIEPGFYLISIDNVNGVLPLVLDNESINITVKKEDIKESEVKGSTGTDLYKAYIKAIKVKYDSIRDLTFKKRTASINNNEQEIKAIDAQIEKKIKAATNYNYKFIKDNSDNIFALLLLEQELNNRDLDLKRITKAFEGIDERLRKTKTGKNVANLLKEIKAAQEKDNALNIGKKAPLFTAPNPEGKQLALNEIMGKKITIIDFWASWCKPCRDENPKLVELYNKYKTKGLEIVGVSLDAPNQKTQWLKAIDDDQLTWPQVSHLQQFNDPVAKLYNIKSIPATFIIDDKGTIIARNVRGADLQNKMKEIFEM